MMGETKWMLVTVSWRSGTTTRYLRMAGELPAWFRDMCEYITDAMSISVVPVDIEPSEAEGAK